LPSLYDIAEHNQENFISGTPARARAFLQHLEGEVRRSSHYVFSGVITQPAMLDSSGDVQGEVIRVDGRDYCRIIASASPYVSFGEGFHDPERHGQGTWCGKRGIIRLRLGAGHWVIILTSWPGTGARAPKITANGQELRPVWLARDGRDQVFIEVSLEKPVLTLCFETPWASVPNGQNRELGFWMYDDILLGPAGAISEATSHHDRLSRSIAFHSERGETIEQLGDHTYLSFKLSTSPYTTFLRGFFGYEAVSDGRWCGMCGDIALALSCGSWDIILQFDARSTPWISVGETLLDITWVADPAGRHLARITVTATHSPLVLSFRSRSAFIPAESNPQSKDRRVLGFWLMDRVMVRADGPREHAPITRQ
jgi:hypothetical protein